MKYLLPLKGIIQKKSILKEKYGKPSDVGNAHIESIIHYLQLITPIRTKYMAFMKNLSEK